MHARLLSTTDETYSNPLDTAVPCAFVPVPGRGDGTVDWSGDTGRIEWTNSPPRGMLDAGSLTAAAHVVCPEPAN